MNCLRKWTVALTVLLCMFTVVWSYAEDNEKVKIRGLITDRTGDSLIVKTSDGEVTVVLTDDTKVQQPKGLGIRKEQMSFAALIPGLKVSVEGTRDQQHQLVAQKITFSGSDLKTAETIQAGMAPTKKAVKTNEQNIAANKVEIAGNRERIADAEEEIDAVTRRFNDLTEFDIKGEVSVYFASGGKTITARDKAALMDLARKAVNLTGYIIQVKGFADSSGNSALNQRLSMDRAQEVIAYLIQDCNVPVRRVIAPGAMGMAEPAASNETAKGRAANRRVEVKVLVNRGLAATTIKTP